MQTRSLFVLAAVGALLAGCAEDGSPGTQGDGGTPPASVSNEQAAALFADAAANIPDKFGMKLAATRSGLALMSADASFDQAAKISFFRMKIDETLAESLGEGASMMGADASMLESFSMYVSPEGNAFLLNDTVMLSAPEHAMFEQAASGGEGFAALTDPEALVKGMQDDGFTVKSVTPTTLRGKGALKIDATVQDESGVQDVTVWIYQDPTRIARIESAVPTDSTEEDGPDPFAGATMEVDLLYDDEVTASPPADLLRALGLRYESNRNPFSFGGGDEGPEVWTFQVDGGIGLEDIVVEVGDLDAGSPEWTMPLGGGKKTEGGITLTFLDADADGDVSEGDTLTIERAEGEAPSTIALRDTVTGLRVVPGAGALLGLLALLGVAATTALARRQ